MSLRGICRLGARFGSTAVGFGTVAAPTSLACVVLESLSPLPRGFRGLGCLRGVGGVERVGTTGMTYLATGGIDDERLDLPGHETEHVEEEAAIARRVSHRRVELDQQETILGIKTVG